MPKILIDNQEYLVTDYATIGRSSKCTIRIKDIKLSRIHCEILHHDNEYLLIDLHSQNGTRLNEEAVTEAILANGDKIALGRAELTFILN